MLIKTKKRGTKGIRTMKNIFRLMSALVVFALLLTACGTPAAPTKEAEKPTEAAKPAEETKPTDVPAADNPDEVITINIWVFEGEEGIFDELIKVFNADYPNIKVEITNIPEDDYTTKIDTALIAGEPPDMAFIYEKKWIKAGEFLPMDDMIAERGIRLADYNQGAFSDACIVDGKVYCLGTYTGAILLFYNKDLFDKAGVAYPSATEPMSMDEYVTMCAKLTTKSDVLEEKVWGCDADIPVWWHDTRYYFSEDGRTIEGYANDDSTVHTFEMLAQLRTDESVIGATDTQSLEGTDLLATGKLATSIIDNVIAIKTLEEAGVNWGAALVPVEQKGDKGWVSSWTDSYGVFTKSKRPQEAMLFVSYLATKGNDIRLSTGDLPLNMTLADQWAAKSIGRQEAITAIKLSRPGLFVPGYWDVIGPLWDAFYGGILEDKRPVKEVLDEYAPQLQETLDLAWETWDSIK
jgi:multiple sugar transport system substrate-binding protein